jgi:hypothetical protein
MCSSIGLLLLRDSLAELTSGTAALPTRPRASRVRLPLGTDAVEEDGSRLVGGVLGDELAFEGTLEDGLAEAVGASEVESYKSFHFVDSRHTSVHFGDESSLLRKRWKRQSNKNHSSEPEILVTNAVCEPLRLSMAIR